MGRWSWVRISRPPWKRFLKKSEFPHVKNWQITLPGSLEIVKNFGVGTYGPIRRPRIPLFKGGGSVIRLGLGRRLVNLLRVAQRTNDFHSCDFVIRLRKIFYKKLKKNVSCEYHRLNGWNSTLQAVWYIRHVRWTCLFYISYQIWFLLTKPTVWLLIPGSQFHKKKLHRIVRACSMFYPHEGYGSVTPLDAARVDRTIFHNHLIFPPTRFIPPPVPLRPQPNPYW